MGTSTTAAAVRSKINKLHGAEATALEVEIAKTLVELGNSNEDIKAEIRGVIIRGAKELTVKDSKNVIIICVPYRVYYEIVRPIQGRLIGELEKKTKKAVVFFSQRKIIPKDFKKKGLKFRPRSRTLTCVHNAILDDIVAPTEIVGKRIRVRSDGKQLLKVQLDPKDKSAREGIEDKLAIFAAVYQSLTRKQAVFHFPTA